MDRNCFESMKPIEVDRDDFKKLLNNEEIGIYKYFKQAKFVDSLSDFKRHIKDGGLSIESGELNFVKVNLNTTIKYEDFIQNLLLIKKGKTQFMAIKLW